MLTLTMDMVQYDCPYIDVTTSHDVSFFANQWDFNTSNRELETRIMVSGADREALENGLQALRAHGNMHDFRLLSRKADRAMIRTTIGETNAMNVIRSHDGYITGPFEIRDGSELWRVGFDSERVADDALSSLDVQNEFDVEERQVIGLEEYYDMLQNADAVVGLLDGCRSLTDVERATLRHAHDQGYFSTPRDATLSTLADEFGVSKTAVSKNLRRAEQKVFDEVVDALSSIHE